MASLKWVALGLTLMMLSGCVWGGTPSLGASSPIQSEHNGSLCDG
jgi:hypothetical protein